MQFEDIPDDLHRVLEASGALAGVSLSVYAGRTLEQAAGRSSREQLIAELAEIEPVALGESAADALAHGRDDLVRRWSAPASRLTAPPRACAP